jgi:two-component system KDP operon response regulator KdpE
MRRDLVHRILIIDDNEDVRSALRAMLEDAGYEVAEAADGAEALSLALRRRPHAILLDLQLPPTGGFEVLQQFKAASSLRKVPVIIVTGSIEDENLRTAKKLGAWDYVNKPWAIGEVEARVRLALQVAGPAGQAPPEPDEDPTRLDTTPLKKRQSARAPERAAHG